MDSAERKGKLAPSERVALSKKIALSDSQIHINTVEDDSRRQEKTRARGSFLICLSAHVGLWWNGASEKT